MNEAMKIKLEMEASDGEEWARIYERKLKPFFDRKRQDLFSFFIDESSAKQENLLLLKLQCNSLTSLENEFIDIIETGRLARQQLNEENRNE